MISTLVVDDDARVAEIHAAFVAKVPGFAVTGLAFRAEEAYETVCATEPGLLLLLDLYLSDEHGLSLLHRLHRRPGPRPDAVVIAAARDVETVRAAMQLGALHYVVKPFGAHNNGSAAGDRPGPLATRRARPVHSSALDTSRLTGSGEGFADVNSAGRRLPTPP